LLGKHGKYLRELKNGGDFIMRRPWVRIDGERITENENLTAKPAPYSIRGREGAKARKENPETSIVKGRERYVCILWICCGHGRISGEGWKTT
jgi:hypothetical protein